MDMDMEDHEMEYDMEDDEMGSQYAEQIGVTGLDQAGIGYGNAMGRDLKKKRKKKKKKRRPVEYEDPSLREHLLAGAYGGIAKKKPKRPGVKYTTDINAGLRDIATPGSAFPRDHSKLHMQKMMGSMSGFAQIAGPESSRSRPKQRPHPGMN